MQKKKSMEFSKIIRFVGFIFLSYSIIIQLLIEMNSSNTINLRIPVVFINLALKSFYIALLIFICLLYNYFYRKEKKGFGVLKSIKMIGFISFLYSYIIFVWHYTDMAILLGIDLPDIYKDVAYKTFVLSLFVFMGVSLKSIFKENREMYTRKWCGSCGKFVDISSKAGQKCPYCGTFWSKEK